MRGFADLTELLGINSIPGICCGWLFLHRRGGHPSQYWGKLTFTECEPQLHQFAVVLYSGVSGVECSGVTCEERRVFSADTHRYRAALSLTREPGQTRHGGAQHLHHHKHSPQLTQSIQLCLQRSQGSQVSHRGHTANIFRAKQQNSQ